MSDEMPSFEAMQNYKFGFSKALYDYLSTKLSMPHSFKYEELDKNTVYYGLYCIIAMRVPDLKSYKAMQISEDVGGIEKELYLAAAQIDVVKEYELVVNKTDSLEKESSILYTTVNAVRNGLAQKADLMHEHGITDISSLESKLVDLTSADANLDTKISGVETKLENKSDKNHNHNITDVINLQNTLTTKQDKLVSGTNISPIQIGSSEAKSLLNNETLKISSNINNVETIGNNLTSHDINVPLLTGEIIVNRLEPQTILVDVGVLWVDCRKIRLKTTEKLVWILTATPTTEEPNKKTWVEYTGQSMFVQYEEGTPVFPEASSYNVGSILVDHKPSTAETYADIYINALQDDNTTHYWRKMSSQDGYMKDPSKPSINGVNVAGARTSQSYGLQDKLEAGKNIKKVQIGEGEPQSLLEYPDQTLVIPTGGGGSSDYNSLVNLPEINETVLKGRLTSTDLKIPMTAEMGDCILARNETYNPMLNIGAIWLDIFKIMNHDAAAAKILDWKAVGSKEKVWVDYDKVVHYEERYDPDYIPHDIPDEQEGDICVVYNDNYVPVFWRVFKLDKVGGVLTWRRVNLIYSYSQIPDKPILNGHRFAGTQTGSHYDLANLYRDTAPVEAEAGDFKVVQEKNPEDDYYHNTLTIYNSNLNAWEEIVQIYSNGKFNPKAEERFNTKQDQLFDSGSGQNIANLIVDGEKHSLLQRGDIVINNMSAPECILTEPDITLDPNEYPVGFFWITGLGTSAPDSNILQEVDGVKTWVRYRRPYAGGVFPEIGKSENGDLFLLTLDDIVSSDDHIYKLIKNATIQKWVELNRGISYLNLPNKPLIEGSVLVGDKSAVDLGLAKSVHAHSIDDVTELKDKLSVYDNSIVQFDTRINNLAGDVTTLNNTVKNIDENKINTAFDKSSTTTSPNCKAIADYIEGLLSSLDGSDEAF